jgi:hypothetical protein
MSLVDEANRNGPPSSVEEAVTPVPSSLLFPESVQFRLCQLLASSFL